MSPAEFHTLVTEIGEQILARAGRTGDPRSLVARIIDHTILKPEATESDVRRTCEEARKYGFASVCVNPTWVALVSYELTGTPVKVCTVVGFPLGAHATGTKVVETATAIRGGAQEIDMVLNIGALRSGHEVTAANDIRAVVKEAHSHGAIVKVILETAQLSDEQKTTACRIAQDAGADFVKTSTGFGPGGATTADVRLMRMAVGPEMGVKASGGIRTLEDVRNMVAAGATRIGASAGVKIIEAISV